MVREAEPPALPTTDDPFELLGVVPPTTELEVRRAYVRRSKQFRPERAPEAFMRIRRAYEQALSRLRWSIYDAASDGEAGAAEDTEDPVAAAQTAAPAADDLAAPSVAAVGAVTTATSRPSAALPAAAIETSDDLLAALVERRPIPGDVLERLPAAELERAAADPHVDWSLLRDQPDRWLGLELFRLGLQRLIMDGEVGRVLDRIGSGAVRGDLIAAPPLEGIVARALIGCAWSADPRADALFDLLAGDGGRGASDHLLALYADARAVATAWAAIPEVSAFPPVRRLVERFAAVSHAHRRELVADVRDAFEREPHRVVAALDAMGKADPRLLFFVHLVTDETVYGEDLAYEDLAPPEQAYIAHAMKTIELVAGPSSHPDGPWLLLAVLAAVGVGKLAVGGFWGTVLGVTILIAASVPYMIRRWVQTARDVRARLIDAVIATGLRPDRMLAWQGSGDDKRAALFGAETGLADDLVLHTLARLARLARQWRA